MPRTIPSSMPISFNGRARRPPQRAPEPEAELPEPDVDPLYDANAEADDYFAAADALAELSHADFYWQLRGEVDRVAAGELPGGTLDAHPAPKDRPRSKRYKRRDKHGRAF